MILDTPLVVAVAALVFLLSLGAGRLTRHALLRRARRDRQRRPAPLAP